MKIRISHVFLLAITLGIAAIWYFGRDRPIEIRTNSTTHEHITSCKKCNGSGAVDCPECGGFGTVDAQAVCPSCKGTGKHKWRFGDTPDAPCQKCRGTGRVEARAKCNHCEGKGKVRCSTCGGTGKTKAHSTTTSQSVAMGFSLWERVLLFLRLSVDPNPCPQVDSNKTYPIVTEYVKVKSAKRPCRIIDWGKFSQRGAEWVMTGTVEFIEHGSTHTIRQIEFIVKNRELVGTKIVQ